MQRAIEKIGKQNYTKQQFVLALILLTDCFKDKHFWAKTLKVKKKDMNLLTKAIKENSNENS